MKNLDTQDFRVNLHKTLLYPMVRVSKKCTLNKGGLM